MDFMTIKQASEKWGIWKENRIVPEQ